MQRKPRRRRAVPATIAAASALVAGLAAAPSSADTVTPVPPFEVSIGPNFTQLAAPLSSSECQQAYKVACYGATQLRRAYNLAPLSRRGIDGRGATIVVVIPYGSPTIQHDLNVYDHQFGLPDTQLRFVQFGKMPAYDPANALLAESAAGTTELVELAHAMAPGAKIVVAETTVGDPSAPEAGIPESLRAEKAMVDAGVGDIFQLIFSTAEGTLPGETPGHLGSLEPLRDALKDAVAHHVTTDAPAGDFGATEFDAGGNLYPHPSVVWPGSDPLVTSVGGAQFFLDDAGRTLSPPIGWNNLGGAGGGGVSEIFKAPRYQAGVSSVVGGHRGVPDISASASVDGGNWIYTSFDAEALTGAPTKPGWGIFDATGGASAEFSGLLALAQQLAGHRLGLINPALYQLGYRSEHGDSHTGLIPITQGDNSFGGVTGYSAGPGYSLDAGWGTIDAARFVPALVKQIDRDEDD